MFYKRLSKGVNSYKLVPETEDLQSIINSDRDQDYYTSIYKYNEDQYNHWKKTGSLSGITDVITDRLVFDFDDSKNPENAKNDTLETISRLTTKGIPEESIQVCFSGRKGFSIEVLIDKTLSVEEFKSITKELVKDLKTYDVVVSDAQRIFRLPCTKHKDSGLYKKPLTINQLVEMNIDQIKNYSSSLEDTNEDLLTLKQVKLPESIYNLRQVKGIKENPFSEAILPVFNIKERPHWLTPAMYALSEGHFEEGERRNALMILAARWKHQGMNKAITYRALKGTCELQALKYNVERFPDEDVFKVVEEVYGPNWKGGQYAKDHPFLLKIAEKMGLDPKDEDAVPVIEVVDIHKDFLDYAKNFDKNIVATGIPELDRNVMFLTSTHNGILGQPGSGKTSLALQWLEHVSMINSSALFYSLDMAKPIIYANMAKRIKPIGFKPLMQLFKQGGKEADNIAEQVAQRYKNVKFSFRSGSSPNSIKDDMKRHEDATGIKTKLLIVDYLECLAGPYSDATANTGFISNQMKDLATELGVCSIMLLQTQKHGGEISDPITSMKRIKGSSIIEQSASVVLTLWREGYDPSTVEQDKYISFAAVKNRFGSLWQDDFYFEGKSGLITDITDDGREDLEKLKKAKAKAREEKLREEQF